MNKIRLHIYGRYLGDIKVIHDVLEESGEYDLTYQYFDIGKGSKPSTDVDYVIASNQRPDWFKGRVIHTHHGLGCIPNLVNIPISELLARYKKSYYALCTFGELHKSWFTEKLGFPNERVLVLLAPVNVQERTDFLQKKGLDPNKKTVMYGPSWGHNEERGIFWLWWQDGKEEERVKKFCEFITYDLNMNLIVRLHERRRYSQDWIKKYCNIFDTYKVNAHYLNQDPYNLPYCKFSDFMVGDLSSLNTYFYVMDKPVVHIGAFPFQKKLKDGWGGMELNERAGYIIEDFQDLLAKTKDSVLHPAKFSAKRKETVDKYIDHLGEDSKEAILNEFRRFLENEKGN